MTLLFRRDDYIFFSECNFSLLLEEQSHTTTSQNHHSYFPSDIWTIALLLEWLEFRNSNFQIHLPSTTHIWLFLPQIRFCDIKSLYISIYSKLRLPIHRDLYIDAVRCHRIEGLWVKLTERRQYSMVTDTIHQSHLEIKLFLRVKFMETVYQEGKRE